MFEKIRKIDKTFLSILALAVVLLFFRVGYRTFWMDETAVLLYLHQGPFEFLVEYFKVPDNHPPLYYWLVVVVNHILPWSEASVRLISIIAGLGIVGVVYRWSNELFGKPYSYVAAFLTAFSSFFVLISQMARYHSLAALLTLVTLYLTYHLLIDGYSKKAFIYFIISYILLNLTDYPHFFYAIVLTNASFAWFWLRKKTTLSIKSWMLGQGIVALTFLPAIWLIFHRVVYQNDTRFFEKIGALTGAGINTTLGILMHFYAFFFGENILPWNYGAFLIGVLVMVVGLIGLIIGVKKKKFPSGFTYVLTIMFALVVINSIFFKFASPQYNFIVYPKYGFAAYPLFIIVLIGGLKQFTLEWQKFFAVVWVIVASFGLYNFYTAQNYFNGSYFNTFKAMEFVRDQSQTGEYLIINGDANIGAYRFYKQKYFAKLEPYDVKDIETFPKGKKAWFFATGSDESSTSVTTANKVPAGFKIISEYNSVPLDPMLMKLKEKVLHRPSYIYKYTVFQIEKM